MCKDANQNLTARSSTLAAKVFYLKLMASFPILCVCGKLDCMADLFFSKEVGNIGSLMLRTFENKIEIIISDIIFNSGILGKI